MYEIAQNVAVVPMTIVNAYLVGNAQSWILVDAGTPGNAGKLREAAEARFGRTARPKAILLTHGHFDHAGSAPDLAALWDVKVYAHALEWPYLTGKSPYPPMDPTGPGFFAAISRFFPSKTANVGDRIANLKDALHSLGFPEWEAIDTPGHTPGHVSFFRQQDRVLLAGDAFATVNMDNFFKLAAKVPEVYRPAVPATTNWRQAHSSVCALAARRPTVIGAGHGKPMENAADQLDELASHFPYPKHGRYVPEPARFDEHGITFLPPAPPDNAPRVAIGMAAGVVAATAGAVILSRRS